MARTLYLFSGLTPNIKQQPYYNIKVFSNYLNYLTTNFICEKVIADDNYRINGNILKVVLNGYVSSRPITYAVEVDAENAETYHRCYFVDAITNQSNMLYLTLSVDLWGTYYNASRIDYLHLIRCNRDIDGKGIYDDLEHIEYDDAIFEASLTPFYLHLLDNNKISINDLALVFSMDYNIQQNLLHDKDVTTTGLFFVKLQDLKTKYNIDDSIWNIINDFVGGLYGIQSISGLSNLPANVSKAYILPLGSVLDAYKYIDSSAKVRSVLKGSEISLTGVLNYVEYGYNRWGVIPASLSIIRYADKDLYVTCQNDINGLKLEKPTNSNLFHTVDLYIEFHPNKINAYFKQGYNAQNITEALEIPIMTTSNYTSTLTQISQSFGLAFNMYKGASKAYASTGASGAGLTTANSLLSLISEGRVKNYAGNGNAFITFNANFTNDKTNVNCPFKLVSYSSLTGQGNKKARYFGANYDLILDTVNEIFSYDLIGAGDYDLTYIKVDEIKIDGLPTYARNEIENAFIRGVELLDYES